MQFSKQARVQGWKEREQILSAMATSTSIVSVLVSYLIKAGPHYMVKKSSGACLFLWSMNIFIF